MVVSIVATVNWGNLGQVITNPVMLNIIQRNMLTLTLPISEQVFATPTRIVSLIAQVECLADVDAT